MISLPEATERYIRTIEDFYSDMMLAASQTIWNNNALLEFVERTCAERGEEDRVKAVQHLQKSNHLVIQSLLGAAALGRVHSTDSWLTVN
jgi:hypothetical protein